VLFAGFDHRLQYGVSLFGSYVKLEAVLSRISCTRKENFPAADLSQPPRIVFHRCQVIISYLSQDLLRIGPLDGQQTGLTRLISQFDVSGQILLQPGKILLNIGCVNDQHVTSRQFVNKQIVNYPPTRQRETIVLYSAVIKRGYVVGRDLL